MRRHVRRHANSNTLRAIDDEVWEAGRQNFRLQFRAIVVADHVNGVAINVANHFHGEFVHTSFGVTHGGGFVSVNGTEVTVTIHKGVAERKRLSHTDEGEVKR